MSNLAKRSLSAIILAPLFLYLMYKGGTEFEIAAIIVFFIAFFEWVKITTKSRKAFFWWVFGFFYTSFACLVLIFISKVRMNIGFAESFPLPLFIVVLIVWINDIFGYIFGKTIGGPKLMPKVSPNKTWAGAVGGVIGSLLLFFVANYFIPIGNKTLFYIALLAFIILPIISQIGDLFESWLKRKFGVKDSGNIIPGHGGILDRIDGLLLVLNVIGLAIYAAIYDKISF